MLSPTKESSMPTIVLRDTETEEVDMNFLLIAGDEELSEGEQQRDVVFMRLPLPSTSPLGDFVGEHKHMEFSARVRSSQEGTSIVFDVPPAFRVSVELESSGDGTWSVSSIGSGVCQLLSSGTCPS
jgi:hypothetical protein